MGDEDFLGVGIGEPARKKSRPFAADTEDAINQSYILGGLKGTAKRLSNIWSWMPSFIGPSMSNEDSTNRDIFSNEVQYLGAMHQSKHKEAPTKRPAISRRSIDVAQIKRDHFGVAGIDASFRFSPSITSTAKAGRILSNRPSISDKYLLKTSMPLRSKLPHLKKSSNVTLNPVKRLCEARYPHLSSKYLPSFVPKLSGRGKFCTQEAFRHEEKMRYKKLLQQYEDPIGMSFGASRVSSVVSVSSDSRSASPQNIISRSHLDRRWTREKVEQIEAKVSKESIFSKAKVFSSPGRKADSSSMGKKGVIMNASAVGNLSNGSALKSTKEPDDDCFIISEDIKVKPRRNSLERILLESPIFDEKWHKELNERYNYRAKMKSENAKKTAEHQKVCEEVRKKAHTTMEEQIELRLKQLELKYPSKIEEIIDEEEEEEEEQLPELTPKMIAVIDDALDGRAPGQVLVDKFNIQITRRDIATLNGLNWLNDEVINFYMNLLMERGKNDNYLNVHAFNTFFYPKLMKMGYSSVRRWTKKVDIFSHDLVLVPVHLGMHWCLATMDFRTKHIRYYDSMLGDNHRCLEALVTYLEAEHQDKKQSKYDTTGWTLDNMKDIPQQMNGSDCGMFACKFSEYLSRDKKITFTQEHMPYFRRRMIYEIVSGKLL